MIAKNMVLSGTVSAQGKNGDGVFLHQNWSIYIPNTVVGDVITFKVIKVEKRRAYGRLVAIESPGPDRVNAPCEVAQSCGGCQLQHQQGGAQRAFKLGLIQSRLSRFVDLSSVIVHPMIYSDYEWGYRHKMQFALGMHEESLTIGLYAPRSHHVVDTNRCFIMADPMNDVITAIKAWHSPSKFPIYNEATGEGVWRFLTIRYAKHTNQLMIILTVAKTWDVSPLIDYLNSMVPLTSVYITIQSDPTSDQVLATDCELVWGEPVIQDVVSGIQCRVSPHSFMQANHWLVDQLYDAIIRAVKPHHTVYDLYCGTGVLTCALAKTHSSVIGVDVNVSAIEDANANARVNQVSPTFYAEDVADFIGRVTSHACIIVDPPRQGCADSVLAALGSLEHVQLIYVSCFLDTLGRDLRQLVSAGYHIESIQGVDMFNHTRHIETIVILNK